MQGGDAVQSVASRHPVVDEGAIEGMRIAGIERLLYARRLDAFARNSRPVSAHA